MLGMKRGNFSIFLISDLRHLLKKDFIPLDPLFQYSNTQRHSIPAEPIISDMALGTRFSMF